MPDANRLLTKSCRSHLEALVDFVGHDVVREPHLRHDPEERFESRDRGLIGRMSGPCLARRPRLRRLREPVLETLELRVHRQQLVQRRRAGARNAGDDERSPDLDASIVGPLLPAVLRMKPARPACPRPCPCRTGGRSSLNCMSRSIESSNAPQTRQVVLRAEVGRARRSSAWRQRAIAALSARESGVIRSPASTAITPTDPRAPCTGACAGASTRGCRATQSSATVSVTIARGSTRATVQYARDVLELAEAVRHAEQQPHFLPDRDRRDERVRPRAEPEHHHGPGRTHAIHRTRDHVGLADRLDDHVRHATERRDRRPAAVRSGFSGSTNALAPICIASDSRWRDAAVTAIAPAPSSRAQNTAPRPIGPAPITSTLSPGSQTRERDAVQRDRQRFDQAHRRPD